MSRPKLVVSIVLVVILGFGFGWVVHFLLRGTPTITAIDTTARPAAAAVPQSKSGFCCLQAGAACVSADNPGACFRAGGRSFNTVQRNCDYFCVNITP